VFIRCLSIIFTLYIKLVVLFYFIEFYMKDIRKNQAYSKLFCIHLSFLATEFCWILMPISFPAEFSKFTHSISVIMRGFALYLSHMIFLLRLCSFLSLYEPNTHLKGFLTIQWEHFCSSFCFLYWIKISRNILRIIIKLIGVCTAQ